MTKYLVFRKNMFCYTTIPYVNKILNDGKLVFGKVDRNFAFDLAIALSVLLQKSIYYSTFSYEIESAISSIDPLIRTILP